MSMKEYDMSYLNLELGVVRLERKFKWRFWRAKVIVGSSALYGYGLTRTAALGHLLGSGWLKQAIEASYGSTRLTVAAPCPGGYNPPPDNVERPEKPTPAPLAKRGAAFLELKCPKCGAIIGTVG